jgi:hypothetical protein
VSMHLCVPNHSFSKAVRFTTSPTSKNGATGLITDNKQQAKQPPKKRKIPALKMTTLAPPLQSTKVANQPHLQTSPIEDANELVAISVVPSTSDNGNRAAVQAGASRLYLEVKQRVAQHSSARRRDKVVKVNNKTISKNIVQPSEPSIIDISSSPPPSDRTPPSVPLPSIAIDSASEDKRSMKEEKPKPKPKKGKKEKPQTMTPAEYALKLCERITLAPEKVSKKKSVNKFLEGMSIFYTGGDMKFASERTRGRMDLVCSYVIPFWHHNRSD